MKPDTEPLSPEAAALGFKSDDEARRHEIWLWQTGGDEFKNWLRSINPDKASRLDHITKGEAA